MIYRTILHNNYPRTDVPFIKRYIRIWFFFLLFIHKAITGYTSICNFRNLQVQIEINAFCLQYRNFIHNKNTWYIPITPEQNGSQFADAFQNAFLNENLCILIIFHSQGFHS